MISNTLHHDRPAGEPFSKATHVHLKRMGSRAKGFDAQLRAFAQARPVTALLVALGAGYCFARLASRL